MSNKQLIKPLLKQCLNETINSNMIFIQLKLWGVLPHYYAVLNLEVILNVIDVTMLKQS